MVDQKVIVSRIEQIEKHLQKLAPYAKLSRERFLRDSLAQDVAEYNLFQIVNHLRSRPNFDDLVKNRRKMVW